ncbi:MAG: response regulator [Planctomycetota bacterium]|jgi:DNA-binding NtrC family response regulator
MANILIADDERRIRDTFKPIFGKAHDITFVGSWPELREALKEGVYHLTITDIVMPGYKEVAIEGILNVFKDHPYPVIFMSGYSEQALTDLPENMRFVAKPFSMSIMKMHMDRLLATVEIKDEDLPSMSGRRKASNQLPPRRY